MSIFLMWPQTMNVISASLKSQQSETYKVSPQRYQILSVQAMQLGPTIKSSCQSCPHGDQGYCLRVMRLQDWV